MKKLPKTDTNVYDTEMKLIGKIYDIFGPTSKFFISIKPENEQLLNDFKNRLNESVYIIDRKKTNKKTKGKKNKK